MEASGPPYKRRRLVNEQSSPSSAPSPQNVRIKREESESPLPQRRVVTSGSKRYVMPNDCEKGQFNFKRNRQVWSQREADALRSRGFKPIRMFIREDGMVIDWESSVPVWSDTLQPAGTDLASVIQRAHAANDQSSGNFNQGASSKSLSGKSISTGVSLPNRKIPPPRPSSTVARLPAKSVSLPLPTQSNYLLHNPKDGGHPNKRMTPMPDLVDEGEMISTEMSPTSRPVERNADTELIVSNKADELQAAALEFLEQYIKVFDGDRSDLASAYSCNAVFSCRMHETRPAITSSSLGLGAFAAKLTSPDASVSSAILGIKQGRLEILTALLSLSSSYKFCAQEDADVLYDFVYLDLTRDMLLICYAEIVDIQHGHKLSLDQSFVLRKKDHDDEDRSSEGLWPLVAVSHQMTVRDLSQLPQRTGGAKA